MKQKPWTRKYRLKVVCLGEKLYIAIPKKSKSYPFPTNYWLLLLPLNKSFPREGDMLNISKEDTLKNFTGFHVLSKEQVAEEIVLGDGSKIKCYAHSLKRAHTLIKLHAWPRGEHVL